jgi:hypothetical protein
VREANTKVLVFKKGNGLSAEKQLPQTMIMYCCTDAHNHAPDQWNNRFGFAISSFVTELPIRPVLCEKGDVGDLRNRRGYKQSTSME